MKRPLAALWRLSAVAAGAAALVVVAGCTTNDAANSAKVRDLAFWCHDNLGITEVHSQPMNDCIRRNWNRDLTETTTPTQ